MTTQQAIEYLVELGYIEVKSEEAVRPGCFFVASPIRIIVQFKDGQQIRTDLTYDEYE